MRSRTITMAVLCLFVLLPACASSRTVQNAPLHAGASRTYETDYSRALDAAREAALETGLQIENVSQVDPGTWIIVAKKGVSALSWGEFVRIVVIREAPQRTRVGVHTMRRFAGNVTAKGDYANSILSNIELKLR